MVDSTQLHNGNSKLLKKIMCSPQIYISLCNHVVMCMVFGVNVQTPKLRLVHPPKINKITSGTQDTYLLVRTNGLCKHATATQT